MRNSQWLTGFVVIAVAGWMPAAEAQSLNSATQVVANSGQCAADSAQSMRPTSSACTGPGFAGSGGAQATWGHLGAGASTSVSSDTVPATQAFAAANASLFDQITIGSTDVTGTGFLTFSFLVERVGFLRASTLQPVLGSGASADVLLDTFLHINGQSFTNRITEGLGESVSLGADGQPTIETRWTQIASVNGVQTSLDDALGTFTYTVPFTFGVPFNLSMALTVQSWAYANGIAEAASLLDASHSFDWAGIQDVTFNGESVAFDLRSASGTDWTQSFVMAVPEPSTGVLLLAGMTAMLIATRRRRAAWLKVS